LTYDEPVPVICPECGEEYETRTTKQDGTPFRCRECYEKGQKESLREWQRTKHQERLRNISGWLIERGVPKRHAESSFETCYGGRRPQETPCLLTGPAGTGKTTLAVCLVREVALRDGFDKVLFVKETTLARELREAVRDDDGRGSRMMEAARRVYFLVLDDMGKVAPTPFMREQIFGLLDHRHSEELSTVITTNLSLEEFSRLYGANYAEALLSRLNEMGEVLNFKGKDRRLAGKK
jgi:DNA replication protein DnaC